MYDVLNIHATEDEIWLRILVSIYEWLKIDSH